MRILINNEEVLCDKNITIEEEMLNTSSVILNNVYPKSWENDKDYVSRFYFPKDYSLCKIYNNDEELIFCGVVKNTGNISLNPREPHYCNLQVLDFKTFLSEGETLDFVLDSVDIRTAVERIVETISGYGIVLGNINIIDEMQIITAYSTQNKTAYDVFQYIADITQSRWTTRLVDDRTIAVDFYDPSLMQRANDIEYTKAYFEENNIEDISFSYSTNDYRNKQVMLSDEVYGGVIYDNTILANGYTRDFTTEGKIAQIIELTINGIPATIITNNQKAAGDSAEFYYTPGENKITQDDEEEIISSGTSIRIKYIPLVEGREIIYNSNEITRIENQTDRKGVVARYENRNDVLDSKELQKVGNSYIKYKGTAEITLKIKTYEKDLFNIGEITYFNAPINDMKQDYMCKKKTIQYIASIDEYFYEYELSNNFNSENEINYFDNQRAKAIGNIGQGEFISRNIDIQNQVNLYFYDLEIEEAQVSGDNILDSILDSPLNN